MDWTKNRGDIETRSQFVERNLAWWKENRCFEHRRRLPYYRRFLEFIELDVANLEDLTVGEVGPGPFGGILEVCKLQVRNKVFIDYMMRELFDLQFIAWPKTNVLYLNTPAEDMRLLPDDSVDLLLSYNALDHGWDAHQAVRECVRVSRRCYLAFDCRGDDNGEVGVRADGHDKDHYQLLRYYDVCTFMDCAYSDTKFKWSVRDMRFKHFPVACIIVEK